MKFINVTRIFWGSQFTVAINPAHVLAVKPVTKEDDADTAQTILYMAVPIDEKDRIFVLEPFEEVLKAING